MMKNVYFERAIFLSWYCSKGDCKFCYMSTQKNRIKNPKLARRTKESILAEVLLCKKLGWNIEFLSGGYESYDFEELVGLIKTIKQVYGKKVWLNIGVLNEKELIKLKPYIEGVCGAVECVNKKIHDYMCPSKPVKEIEKMFKICNKLKIKKAMTLILGLGEKLSDFPALKKFISKNKVDKIIFYRLKPEKNTEFEKIKPITKEYYSEWVKFTRENFTKLIINVGSWIGHFDEIKLLIKNGANNVTKFPVIKMFGSKYAQQIEQECNKYSKFLGTLTKLPNIKWSKEVDKMKIDEELKKRTKIKLKEYLEQMKSKK